MKVGEQVENIVTRGDVDAAGGFVHEHELRAPKERSREEHALLLPAGEFADVTLGQIANTQALQHRGGFGLLGLRSPRQAPSGARHEDALLDRDREIPVDCF